MKYGLKDTCDNFDVGDIILPYYMDFKIPFKVVGKEVKNIPIKDVRCSSLTESFKEDSLEFYMTDAKMKRFNQSFDENKAFPLRAVKHRDSINYPCKLNPNGMVGAYEDIRLVDGHHRFLYCLHNRPDIESIPLLVYYLETAYIDKEEILLNLGPWEHTFKTPAGVDLNGAYINPESKFSILKEHLDFENKSVLDLGCSDGWYCFKAVELGASRSVGVDIEPKRHVRSRYMAGLLGQDNSKFILQNINDYITTSKDKFDLILMISILHFLGADPNIFNRLHNLLNDGGEVIIENRGNPNKKYSGVQKNRNGDLEVSLGWIIENIKNLFDYKILHVREHNGNRQIIKLTKK